MRVSFALDGLAKKRVVVLPDLYIDALVRLPEWPETVRRMEEVAARGGGNVPVGPIEFRPGGNAANLAIALARLGAEVDLIACTDQLGMALLQRAAAGTKLRTGLVRVSDSASATLALEAGAANIMLSHAGPLRSFHGGSLTDQDRRRIEAAHAVAVVNWAQTARGTELIEEVAATCPPSTFLFVDTGDVRHRMGDLPDLLGRKGLWERVDAWGMNENELRACGGETAAELRQTAMALSERLRVRLDVHTSTHALSVMDGDIVDVPAPTVRPRRLTGAGDAWNAGDLAGHLLGLPHEQRLRLAHAVAAAYITSADGVSPLPLQLRL